MTIDYLDVKNSDIETGAGKFEIKKGNINNLDLDLGVGESGVTSKITGYNEIDTSMETEETPEAREATIAWEKRQLEIMDWITNDVDWIT